MTNEIRHVRSFSIALAVSTHDFKQSNLSQSISMLSIASSIRWDLNFVALATQDLKHRSSQRPHPSSTRTASCEQSPEPHHC